MTIDIRRAIIEEPASIAHLCVGLDINKYAYVPPKLYTDQPNPGTRTWSWAKAERNIDKISTILDGADCGGLDFEKLVRRILRHPDRYTSSEKMWAIDQWVAMVTWFSKKYPKVIFSDWNFTIGRKPGQYDLAESLVIEHCGAIDVSMFHRPSPNHWQRQREILLHHRELADAHGKKLVVSMSDRKRVDLDDGIREYIPLSRDELDEMLDLAVPADITVDVVWLWSNTNRVGRLGPPHGRVLTEMMDGTTYEQALPEINANMANTLAEFRLRAEAVG